LLPGDLEQGVERMLAAQQGQRLKADILVAGHHGSATSTSSEFLAAVQGVRIPCRRRLADGADPALRAVAWRSVERFWALRRERHHAGQSGRTQIWQLASPRPVER
jgi:hypothetical protein